MPEIEVMIQPKSEKKDGLILMQEESETWFSNV